MEDIRKLILFKFIAYGIDYSRLSYLMDRLPDRLSIEDCWIWTGSTLTKGKYGSLQKMYDKNGNRIWSTHRLMYDVFYGDLDCSLTIDHLCFETSCCNPLHLEQVTLEENSRRMNARRTHCKNGHLLSMQDTKGRGCVLCRIDRNDLAKIERRRSPSFREREKINFNTAQIIREEAKFKTNSQLMENYNLSAGSISMIINNQIWIDPDRPTQYYEAPNICKRGHLLIEENIKRNKNGGRQGCKVCHREEERVRTAFKTGQKHHGISKCDNGHLLIAGNLKMDLNYEYQCRQCSI